MYENNTYSYQNDQMTFNQFLTKSFGVMFTGILLTAITALFGLPILLSFIQSFIGVFLIYGINIGIAFYFSSRLMTMSKTTAYLCFYLYCFVTGMSFTLILYIHKDLNLSLKGALASTSKDGESRLSLKSKS